MPCMRIPSVLLWVKSYYGLTIPVSEFGESNPSSDSGARIRILLLLLLLLLLPLLLLLVLPESQPLPLPFFNSTFTQYCQLKTHKLICRMPTCNFRLRRLRCSFKVFELCFEQILLVIVWMLLEYILGHINLVPNYFNMLNSSTTCDLLSCWPRASVPPILQGLGDTEDGFLLGSICWLHPVELPGRHTACSVQAKHQSNCVHLGPRPSHGSCGDGSSILPSVLASLVPLLATARPPTRCLPIRMEFRWPCVRSCLAGFVRIRASALLYWVLCNRCGIGYLWVLM